LVEETHMPAKHREQILIVFGLIGVNILLGWFLGRLWKDYRSRTQWLYVGAPAQLRATPAGRPNQAGAPQSFVEIVDRNVFSPLRGSPPPPQPQVEAKAPKLPFLFGTMNLGDGWFALMAPGDQASASKRVLPGEEIGGYKLASIGASNVVIAWQDKKITLDISESARHVPGIVEKSASASPRPAQVTTAGSAGQVTTVGRLSGGAAFTSAGKGPGFSPDALPGTVVEGRRKTLVPTPFGSVVQWLDVGQSGSQAPGQTGNPNK
jgi:hypothetical protein